MDSRARDQLSAAFSGAVAERITGISQPQCLEVAICQVIQVVTSQHLVATARRPIHDGFLFGEAELDEDAHHEEQSPFERVWPIRAHFSY